VASAVSWVIGRSAVAPVLSGPTVRAEQVTQLVLGATASVVESNGDWRRVAIHSDGYHGWIHTGYLQEVDDKVAAEWQSRASGWSDGARVRLEHGDIALPVSARVILQGDVVVLPDEQRGRVIEGSIRQLPEVQRAARTLSPERWARTYFLGSPYLWGGITSWGVDCSGLVQTTFAARGVQLPRDSAQQAGCGEQVGAEAMRPGDLLFFSGESGHGITHVAFAAERDTLVHSTLACGATLHESWEPGTRAAALRSRLVAVRRLEPR
jgi:gamma-D-glutamyl-L-lysine dipeptidyl-peptidase